MTPLARAWTLIAPALWAGMLIAIDAIEAPLKFQAPGITIPLGLGIGRLVFTALNVAEAIVAISWLAVLLRAKAPRRELLPLGAAGAILAAKILVIRPMLWAHTDAVLAGESSGGSWVHLVYIGADLVLGLVLCWALWRGVRGLAAADAGARGAGAARAAAPARSPGRGASA